jgi:hypothetical protein
MRIRGHPRCDSVAIRAVQRGGAGVAVQRLLDVEQQQQLAIELVDAADQVSRRPAQRRWRRLERVRADLENVADLVDQQTDDAVLGADDDADRWPSRSARAG